MTEPTTVFDYSLGCDMDCYDKDSYDMDKLFCTKEWIIPSFEAEPRQAKLEDSNIAKQPV